jgi:hypothetical protein
MSTHLFDHRSPPPRSRTAWLTSFAVHGSLLAVLGYFSWTTLGGNRTWRPADETAVVLGLGDGASEATKNDDSEKPLLETPPAEAELGDGLPVAAAMLPLPTGDAATEPLTPAPQLSMLALGDANASASQAATPTSRGAANVSQQLGQLTERAKVTVFGAVGEGSRFVYLFDRSTSMDGAPLVAAKEQLLASLEALKPVHQFQVIFFNNDVQAWDITGGQQRIPYASDSNKRLAAEFVRGITAAGGTDRLGPLRRALAMQPDVIFFLTDADDVMSSFDVADVIERAGRIGAAIVCIEFGEGPRKEGQNFLTRLAQETGGDYAYVEATRLFKE